MDNLRPMEKIHARLHELRMDLDTLHSRVVGISVYELPPDITTSELILFALHIFDDGKPVTISGLAQVFAKCGEYETQKIYKTIFAQAPYLNMGEYNDAIELLHVRGAVTSVEGNISLTPIGAEAAESVFEEIRAQTTQ